MRPPAAAARFFPTNGLGDFFALKQEILPARTPEDVVLCLNHIGRAEARAIGRRARERMLEEHSASRRAIQFEAAVAGKTFKPFA